VQRAVVVTQYRRVTDGQTDGQTDGIAVIASTALAKRRAVKIIIFHLHRKRSKLLKYLNTLLLLLFLSYTVYSM